MVKSRVSRSRIDVVTDVEGIIYENESIPNAFVTHYENFLGQADETGAFNSVNLFKVCLNDQEALDMVREVTNKEIKDAMFSMGDDKSPGPDGFTAAFFKEAWSIIENDVSFAVREFFRNGTLLKELNHTIIALIPKVKMPTRVNDYRLNLAVMCAFKVDIQKAYDTVDWSFLRMVLLGFGFHDKMVNWIMECVTTTSYSICINGTLACIFKAKVSSSS
ncbi:hypothetical protein Tco_0296073 [Tanacetum coccineum]